MTKEERVTPSGIVVVEELTEADTKQAPQEVRNVVKGSPWIKPHKLTVEQRRQRREDNNYMKKIRQTTRRRKKHGRSR